MPIFGHKLPREMQFLPKFKSKMGAKWEICFSFLGQFEFSDSLKLPDPNPLPLREESTPWQVFFDFNCFRTD